MYLQDFFFSSRSSGPTYHSFAMTLSSGHRVYGHVRRYFPHHNVVRTRIDVGRRSERAMVLLTRSNGGNQFYNALLKAVDSISSLHYATHNSQDHVNNKTTNPSPQESFLHKLYREHSTMVTSFQSSLVSASASPGTPTPNFVTIGLNQLELNNSYYTQVDLTKFIIPTSLLVPQHQSQSIQIQTHPSDALILPLVRCIGIANTLRLLSSLMCERRTILISSSISRLTACMNAITSILSQGSVQLQIALCSIAALTHRSIFPSHCA